MPGAKDRVVGAYDVIKGTAKKFGAENGPMIAAAVSFYALLSLIPLLLLAVSVLGFIVGSSEAAFTRVTGMLSQFLPTTGFIDSTLQGLVRSRGVIGIVGLLSLLWTGSQFFVILETALNDIWEVKEKPSFIKARAKAIVMVLVFGALMLLSIASSSIGPLLQHSSVATSLGYVGSALVWAASLLGLVFAIGMFVVLYKYVPDTEVPWRSALIGAVFAAIAWSIAKGLYGLYLTHANFSRLYGSLGTVVILVLWIYYSSVITIFGAEIGYVNQHGPREEPEQQEYLNE